VTSGVVLDFILPPLGLAQGSGFFFFYTDRGWGYVHLRSPGILRKKKTTMGFIMGIDSNDIDEELRIGYVQFICMDVNLKKKPRPLYKTHKKTLQIKAVPLLSAAFQPPPTLDRKGLRNAHQPGHHCSLSFCTDRHRHLGESICQDRG
jgi:hypothetical protein